jgi:hypothetical protein
MNSSMDVFKNTVNDIDDRLTKNPVMKLKLKLENLTTIAETAIDTSSFAQQNGSNKNTEIDSVRVGVYVTAGSILKTALEYDDATSDELTEAQCDELIEFMCAADILANSIGDNGTFTATMIKVIATAYNLYAKYSSALYRQYILDDNSFVSPGKLLDCLTTDYFTRQLIIYAAKNLKCDVNLH